MLDKLRIFQTFPIFENNNLKLLFQCSKPHAVNLKKRNLQSFKEIKNAVLKVY